MSSTTKPTGLSTDVIEAKIDKAVAGNLSVTGGLVAFRSVNEVMEFAKVMAIAGQAIPPHLRNQIGFCLSICTYAIEWRFSPFAVANKSYVVNDRLCFESQLIHAVIEQRAPLIGRLKHSFLGTGDKRQCKVWAIVRGESEPMEYTSPEIKDILPKNSPLWKTKPDLQLFYNASRDWARMHFPEVIMGVYTNEEMEDSGNATLLDRPDFPVVDPKPMTATQQLTQRLAAMTPIQQVEGVLTDEEKEAILEAERTQS